MGKAPDLFEPFLEKLNLLLPFGFMLGLGIFYWAGFKMGPSDVDFLNLLTWYLFMDTTHTGFTLVMFGLLPEPRAMLVDAAHRFKAWFVLAALLFLLFPIYFLATWTTHIEMDARWGWFVYAVINGLWNQHAISQVFGISLLYNRQLPDVSAREAKWERIAFKFLIYMSAIVPFIFVELFAFGGIGAFFFVTISSMAILTILWISFRQSRRHATHKFVYQLRLILWAMGTQHPIALSGTMAFHAVEYLAVTERMYKRSSFAKTTWHPALFWGLAMVAYPVVRYTTGVPADFKSYGLLAAWLIAFGRTVDFFHYYVDGVMFRFREPEPRQWVAPLL